MHDHPPAFENPERFVRDDHLPAFENPERFVRDNSLPAFQNPESFHTDNALSYHHPELVCNDTQKRSSRHIRAVAKLLLAKYAYLEKQPVIISGRSGLMSIKGL